MGMESPLYLRVWREPTSTIESFIHHITNHITGLSSQHQPKTHIIFIKDYTKSCCYVADLTSYSLSYLIKYPIITYNATKARRNEY